MVLILNGKRTKVHYVFIEAMADGLVKNGMSRAQAYSIVPQMIMGTASYFMKSGRHPGELKDAICYAIDKIMDRKHSS